MEKQQIEDFLRRRPSYLKKGLKYLAQLFDSTEELCEEARRKIKEELSIKGKFFSNEDELAAIKYYISQGSYQKAKKLIDKIESKKDIYVSPNIRNGVYIIFGCLHFPFHNQRMWDAALTLISDTRNLAGVILAGDILDMHSISRHAKGKITMPDYDLTQEYEETNVELDKLDQAISDRNIIKEYFYGNHEDWFNQWGTDTDNFKLGKVGATSPFDYCFKKRGYSGQFNWKKAKIEIGDIKIIHGEWVNIHSAHKHMMQMHQKVVFFHTHRMNTFYESGLYGLNCGWGGDKDKKVFNYASESVKSRWKNGFCIIEVRDEGIFPIVLPFENNKFYYNGKVY